MMMDDKAVNELTDVLHEMISKYNFEDYEGIALVAAMKSLEAFPRWTPIMKLFLVDHPSATWCDDYSMAVLAEDEKQAEIRARLSSGDYRNAQDLTIKEIDLNEEQCVLIANVGS